PWRVTARRACSAGRRLRSRPGYRPSRSERARGTIDPVRWAVLQTPVGPVSVGVDGEADGEAVCAVRLGAALPDRPADPPGGRLAEAVAEPRAYCDGGRTGLARPPPPPGSR